MTKSLMALLVVLLTTTAWAGDHDNAIGINYAFRDTVGDNKDDTNRQGMTITYARKLNQNWNLDLNEQFRTEQLNSDNGTSSTRVESGLTYSTPLNSEAVFYTRTGLGYKFGSTEDHTYYSMEPGFRVAIEPKWSVRMGYRFRDSFSPSYQDQTNTARLGIIYDVTDRSVLNFGVDRSYKDSEFVGYNAGYMYLF